MAERVRVMLVCDPEGGRTKQSFKDDADINVLVKRWLGGVPIPQPDTPGLYGDFSTIGTFQEAQNMMGDAVDHFMMLPAAVRAEFGNDPGQMMNFMSDPANAERAKEMGLVPPDLIESAEPAAPPVPGEGGISGGETPSTEGE